MRPGRNGEALIADATCGIMGDIADIQFAKIGCQAAVMRWGIAFGMTGCISGAKLANAGGISDDNGCAKLDSPACCGQAPRFGIHDGEENGVRLVSGSAQNNGSNGVRYGARYQERLRDAVDAGSAAWLSSFGNWGSQASSAQASGAQASGAQASDAQGLKAFCSGSLARTGRFAVGAADGWINGGPPHMLNAADVAWTVNWREASAIAVAHRVQVSAGVNVTSVFDIHCIRLLHRHNGTNP